VLIVIIAISNLYIRALNGQERVGHVWVIFHFRILDRLPVRLLVLVGSTTTPIVFRYKGLSALLGVIVGVGVGVLSGVVFMLLLVILKPLADVLDQPFLGALLSLIASAALILVLLGFLKRFVPSPIRQGAAKIRRKAGRARR